MRKVLIPLLLFLSVSIAHPKTLEYGFIGGKWMCNERVSISRNYTEEFYKKCNSNNLWDILNWDDQVWIADGKFHSNTYDTGKPPKNKVKNCGLVYRNGVTYKYPPCIKTFKY